MSRLRPCLDWWQTTVCPRGEGLSRGGWAHLPSPPGAEIGALRVWRIQDLPDPYSVPLLVKP